MLTCHIGCGLGFIDEQEPQRIEIELLVEPALSRFQDVQATLLYRMPSLFALLFVSNKKAVQLRLAADDAMGNQSIAKFEKGAVPILADPSDDQSGMSISLVRIAVAVEWTGRNIPFWICRLRQRLTIAALTPKR